MNIPAGPDPVKTRSGRRFGPGAAWLLFFAGAMLLFGVLGLMIGSVHLPFTQVWQALVDPLDGAPASVIVRQVRLPQVLTAALAGGGLAASGLLMQTVFHNPLAGPGVLGITSGAALGVALVTLSLPIGLGDAFAPEILAIVSALAGAMGVLLLILLADRRLGDGLTLLIAGLMVGYLCSAIISVLQSASSALALKNYVTWGMGSFAGVRSDRLLWLAIPVGAGLLSALLLIKPLNALLLGEEYASSSGTDVRRARAAAIWTTGLLAASITAFCGPVAFLGLAVPHIARAFVRTSDHALLMPASILSGSALAIACDLVVRASASSMPLPLNAVTSLLGAPVVLWVLLGRNHWVRR